MSAVTISIANRACILFACVLGVALLDSTFLNTGYTQPYLKDLPTNHPAIQYFETPVSDAIAKLNAQLNQGTLTLEHQKNEAGYLPSLLDHLDIPFDSQVLVFSKTSFQADRISPKNPRAIYFNDDIAVGFIRGSEDLEVVAVDPYQGPIFYTANIDTLTEGGFTRRKICLTCHQGPATSGVPGIFVGSVFPDVRGKPSPVDAIITDHRTNFKDRWGGWYVNSVRGHQKDRANAIASNPAQPLTLDDQPQNLRHLYGKIDPSDYLSPTSDIVALMTFEHQTQMTNYITRIGWEARILEHDESSDVTLAQLDSDIEAMIAYMLFSDEAPLIEPVEGASTFRQTFEERGPRDDQGRSLRDFDLQTRLFRYPLSYMVYSHAFNALPARILDQIYQRLYAVLTSRNNSKKFENLSQKDLQAALEILKRTKTDLPGYWQ